MDVLTIFEKMAEHGHAPSQGCGLLGVGYEDAFERLRQTYLIRRFKRGGSAEKFIVGPFGSGKTHFLRQLMEIASALGCATAEVSLNKNVDFTKNLMVYREVAREIKLPSQGKGIKAVLVGCLDQVLSKVQDSDLADQLASSWVSGLDSASFQLEAFGRMAKRALAAYQLGDTATFDAASRWLSGEVSDRYLAKELGLAPVPDSEQNLFAQRALYSLPQLIRLAGFPGTVFGFDEAEQGFSVDNRKMQQILSMLQSGINAVVDLENASLLVVFALTPDLVSRMENFEALRQRVTDPGEGQRFFDGNVLAPKIDLTIRQDPAKDLEAIGRRLTEVFYDNTKESLREDLPAALTKVSELANKLAESDPSISNRREMVKRTCSMLLGLYKNGVLDDRPRDNQLVEEDEV